MLHIPYICVFRKIIPDQLRTRLCNSIDNGANNAFLGMDFKIISFDEIIRPKVDSFWVVITVELSSSLCSSCAHGVFSQ